MLETFGMQQGGSQYHRLIGAFQRVFGATIFFGTDTQRERAIVTHQARFNFMREALIVPDRPASVDGDCDAQLFRRQATKEIECSVRFVTNRLALDTNFS
jgi:hypothetical protein